MLLATIVAQFVKIWDENSNYNGKIYNILCNKIWYFLNIYYLIAIKQLEFYTIFIFIPLSQARDYFVSNIN